MGQVLYIVESGSLSDHSMALHQIECIIGDDFGFQGACYELG
jgi:hypothetical protein